MVKIFCWTALDCTGVPNKLATECIFQLSPAFVAAKPVQIRQNDTVSFSKNPQRLKCAANCAAEEIASGMRQYAYISRKIAPFLCK